MFRICLHCIFLDKIKCFLAGCMAFIDFFFFLLFYFLLYFTWFIWLDICNSCNGEKAEKPRIVWNLEEFINLDDTPFQCFFFLLLGIVWDLRWSIQYANITTLGYFRNILYKTHLKSTLFFHQLSGITLDCLLPVVHHILNTVVILELLIVEIGDISWF